MLANEKIERLEKEREKLEIRQPAMEEHLSKPTNRPLSYFIDEVKREREKAGEELG